MYAAVKNLYTCWHSNCYSAVQKLQNIRGKFVNFNELYSGYRQTQQLCLSVTP